MSGLNKIEAPSLAPQYGSNVKQVFEQIDQNFNVLANRELYKGDAGKDLIAVNIPWSNVFVIPTGASSWAQTITVVVGGVTYYVSNFAGFIESALGTLSSEPDDVSAAINGLKESGSVTVCFEDKETSTSNPATVLSSIPFVFVDLRFRNTTTFSNLANKTDMSCVITCTGVWACTQNFPTLYYGVDDNDEGNLYWKINGQNTSILASGPKGQDGSTGEVYIGLTDDMKLSYNNDQSGTLHGDVENIDITYLLTDISSDSDDYNNLSPESQSHFPFITIDDWVAIHGDPINGAPIIIMAEDSTSMEYDSNLNLGVPYYISNIYYVSNSATSTVSKYNICYAHMNDNTVKNAIINNVLTLPQSMPSGLGQDELPGYSIKERGEQTSGYSIFVPYGATYKELVISYVSDINNPSEEFNANKSKFRIVGSLAQGSGSVTASGDFSHAEGEETEAGGDYSHAEGFDNYASGTASHTEGYDTRADGDYSHAEGSSTKALGESSHAEGNLTHSRGAYSHAEGTISIPSIVEHAWKDIEITITAVESAGTILYYDWEGSPDPLWDPAVVPCKCLYYPETNETREIIIDGAVGNVCRLTLNSPFSINPSIGDTLVAYRLGTANNASHVEGQNCLSYGVASHAEGGQTVSYGSFSHAEGFDNISRGSGSHAEGNTTIANGNASHAEGSNTTAKFDGCHSEGKSTNAKTPYSHTEGFGTDAGTLISEFRVAAYEDYYASASGSNKYGRVTYIFYKTTPFVDSPNATQQNTIKTILNGVSYTDPVTNFTRTINSSDMEFVLTRPNPPSAGSSLKDYAYYYTWLVGGSAYGMLVLKFESLASGNYRIYPAVRSYLNETWYDNNYSYLSGVMKTPWGASHGEGFNTTASGDASHSEGYDTYASAIASHAEGYNTRALGDYSHAEGLGTIADMMGSHACGSYNAPGYVCLGAGSGSSPTRWDARLIKNLTDEHGGYTTSSDYRIIFSVGCGDSSDEIGQQHRTNGLIITANGCMFYLKKKYSSESDARTYYGTHCDEYEGYKPTFA